MQIGVIQVEEEAEIVICFDQSMVHSHPEKENSGYINLTTYNSMDGIRQVGSALRLIQFLKNCATCLNGITVVILRMINFASQNCKLILLFQHFGENHSEVTVSPQSS